MAGDGGFFVKDILGFDPNAFKEFLARQWEEEERARKFKNGICPIHNRKMTFVSESNRVDLGGSTLHKSDGYYCAKCNSFYPVERSKVQ